MGRVLSHAEQMWRTVPESQVQEILRDFAQALAVPYHHETDSRRSPRGWPDTAIPVAPVLWIIEAKKELGRLKPEQIVWGDALRQCTRVEYRVARPSSVGAILEEMLEGSEQWEWKR